MSVQKVLIYPHALLRTPALPITREQLESPELDNIIVDLQETLSEHCDKSGKSDGAALAATQVGLPARIVVLADWVKDDQLPGVLLNPKITWYSEERVAEAEGCLSFPGITLSIFRPERIVLEFMERNGELRRENFGNCFLARCLQHEVDHLDGKLFIDYVDRKQRFAINALMTKSKISGRQ